MCPLCNECLQGLERNKISFSKETFLKYQRFLDEILSQMQTGFRDRVSVSLPIEVMNQIVGDLEEVFAALERDLTQAIAGLAITEEERRKQVSYQKLVRGKEYVLQNLAFAKEIGAFRSQIKDLRIIVSGLLELQNSTMRRVLNTIRDRHGCGDR